MINCKTCRNTKNCVYAGEETEREECIDHIPTTNLDRIHSMTDEELAEWLNDMQGYSFSCGLIESRISEYPNRYNAWLKWLREEVEA